MLLPTLDLMFDIGYKYWFDQYIKYWPIISIGICKHFPQPAACYGLIPRLRLPKAHVPVRGMPKCLSRAAASRIIGKNIDFCQKSEKVYY